MSDIVTPSGIAQPKSQMTIMVKKKAREMLIRKIFDGWYQKDPKTAKEVVRYIREITAQEVMKHGQYLSEDDPNAEVQVTIRFPATLMWALRRVFPNWGDDSRDLVELIEMFPDLVPRSMRNRLKSKRCRRK